MNSAKQENFAYTSCGLFSKGFADIVREYDSISVSFLWWKLSFRFRHGTITYYGSHYITDHVIKKKVTYIRKRSVHLKINTICKLNSYHSSDCADYISFALNGTSATLFSLDL